MVSLQAALCLLAWLPAPQESQEATSYRCQKCAVFYASPSLPLDYSINAAVGLLLLYSNCTPDVVVPRVLAVYCLCRRLMPHLWFSIGLRIVVGQGKVRLEDGPCQVNNAVFRIWLVPGGWSSQIERIEILWQRWRVHLRRLGRY